MKEISGIVDRAMKGDMLTGDQIAQLFEVPLFTPEVALIQVAARQMSYDACAGKAEVHAKIGLNVAPCPRNCQFYAFAACNGVFSEATEVPVEEVVLEARTFERDGANSIFPMGTADYPMGHAREAGLHIGTCVEPVGSEHTTAELVEKTLITQDAKPAYSGSARRIPIPGTAMAKWGIVSEVRMAHILAVVRLAVGANVPGNCTHEPSVIGAAAGATLLWAEVGANPRDAHENTKGARGMTVEQCRTVLKEAEWQLLDGPSRMYEAGA